MYMYMNMYMYMYMYICIVHIIMINGETAKLYTSIHHQPIGSKTGAQGASRTGIKLAHPLVNIQKPSNITTFNEYPLGNVYITMENHQFPMGKLTISMAMFNSYVINYQKVN